MSQPCHSKWRGRAAPRGLDAAGRGAQGADKPRYFWQGMRGKLAIVIFNLGGPDSPAAVRPFLFNLFNDARIVALPQPFRWLIATAISTSRAKKSRGYYARLGGRSVLLEETQAQAAALTAAMKVYAEN